jgi:hypothetical protein
MTEYTDDRIMCDFDWNDGSEEQYEFLSSDSMMNEHVANEHVLPCFVIGLSHERLYKTSKRVAKIICDGLIYRIFIDQQNNGAVLIIPNMHYDIWFPLHMTVRDVIYHYFGERLVLTGSLYTPMSHARFCTITL